MKTIERIVYEIDYEGFSYWLTDFYRREECEMALSPETLRAFDAAKEALSNAHSAASAAGLFEEV